MVNSLIRESTFGQIVRVVTKKRYFQYPEEANPAVWREYVDQTKSARMARYGATLSPEPTNQADDIPEDVEKEYEDEHFVVPNARQNHRPNLDAPKLSDPPSASTLNVAAPERSMHPSNSNLNMRGEKEDDEQSDHRISHVPEMKQPPLGQSTRNASNGARRSTSTQNLQTGRPSTASSQTQIVEPTETEPVSPSANQHGPPDGMREMEPEEKEARLFNEFSGVEIDPEKGRDVDIVDWYGADDPEVCIRFCDFIADPVKKTSKNTLLTAFPLSQNPMNWSTGKKFFVTFEICLLTFAIYIGSAIYTAGLVDVTETFGVSEVAAEVGLTLFVFGYGVGPMLWSPMSEIPQIGRNPIYISTLFVFAILQIPTALTSNFGSLLFLRFITGFIGSPCLATGGASLADIYRPQKRAYAISVWGIAAVCGPVMGPLVGGFAAEAKGWRWTIWELCWLSGATFVVLFFFLPETSSAALLYKRTARLRALSGNDKLKCEPEIEGEGMTGMEVVRMMLIRPISLNFLEPMVLALNMYIALIYGLLYIWFESFPIVFIEVYGFSLGTQGLAFLGILIGAFITIPPFFWYLATFQEPKFDANGNIQPEKRLPPAIPGGVAIVICLFWFGWSAGRTHWIMPIIGSAFFSVGAFLLFNSVLNYLPDAYPSYAASVLAGNDFMRSSFGAAFPLFARQMYTRLGVDWASSLLGFLAVCFVPIPVVLWMYGEGLRKNHSKYARKDI
ncbi:MAG: hypothetical protein M1831_006897 [Alyxoria varia]|nr:MAG: hypothetical protein M1831_006897 [Alyxoria varia]